MLSAVLALVWIADVDVKELMARVAERYGELKRYSLEVVEQRVMVRRYRVGTANKMRSRLDVGGGERYYFRQFPETERDLDSSPVLTIVRDDESVWRDEGNGRRRVEYPGFPSDRAVSKAMQSHVERFASPEVTGRAGRFLKMERVRGRECAVVQLEAPPERLWIEVKSAAVLRSDTEEKYGARADRWVRDYVVPPGEREPDEKLLGLRPGERRRR